MVGCLRKCSWVKRMEGGEVEKMERWVVNHTLTVSSYTEKFPSEKSLSPSFYMNPKETMLAHLSAVHMGIAAVSVSSATAVVHKYRCRSHMIFIFSFIIKSWNYF